MTLIGETLIFIKLSYFDMQYTLVHSLAEFPHNGGLKTDKQDQFILFVMFSSIQKNTKQQHHRFVMSLLKA